MLTAIQIVRIARPELFVLSALACVRVDHGSAGGGKSMMAVRLAPSSLSRFLVSLPNLGLVGAGAWFSHRRPDGAALQRRPRTIRVDALSLDLVLLPAVFTGIALGRG